MRQSKGFFAQVDALIAKGSARREATKEELHALGWRLLRTSVHGMWRASHRKHRRIYAPTPVALVGLAKETSARHPSRPRKSKAEAPRAVP